jgi:acyl carrier protein
MTLDDLKAIFTEYLDLPAGVDWADVRYQETVTWDSLAHMAIVGELEDRLQIMLDIEDVIDMSSFDAVIRTLDKYGFACV